MKRIFYALSLLLSFLIVVGHDLIPHQHDITDYGVIDNSTAYQKQSNHHIEAAEHNHDGLGTEAEDQKSDHNRKPSFPYHNHFFSDTDFDYTRLNTNNSISVKQSTKTFTLHSTLNNNFTQLPSYRTCHYRTKPFLTRSLYQPAAIALRGPPAIA